MPDRLLLGLLAVALLLRLWGIGDRLPDSTLGINVLDDTVVEETDRTTMGRAWMMWRGGTKKLDLNPHTGGWPGFSFYLTFGLQLAYKGSYSLVNPGTTAADFARHIANESGGFFLFARVVGAAIGVLTVWLTYLLGTRIGGRNVGLLAGLLLTANPLHILTSQHISDPNLLALLFVLVAAIALVDIASGRGGAWASIVAGAAIGLAGACKYVPLVLAVLLLAVHARTPRTLGVALGAMAAALFVASPFTFLDWKTTLRDITVQRESLFSDWVGQSDSPISLPTYVGVALPHALGWPGYLLGLAGAVLLWRGGTRGRIVVWVAAVVVLANGILKSAQERYVLVALPAFLVGCAAALLAAARHLGARPWARAATLCLGALTLLWPVPELVALRSALAKPDTRHLARRWINEHIAPDRRMAVELYGPVYNTGGKVERAIVIWPFFATRAPLVRAAYHPAFLDGLDYIVTSSEVSRRFQADSLSYPVEWSHCRWIRERTEVIWTSENVRSTGPRIEVRALPGAISTRAERDSIFGARVPEPTGVTRLALWCSDLADLFGRSNDLERAAEWAARGLEVGAANLDGKLYNSLTFALLRQGRAAEAESTARLGLARFPRSGPLHTYRGLALEEMGRLEDAVAAFRSGADRSGDRRVLVDLGRVLSRMGRYEEAIEALDRIPPTHPERGAARRNMGIIYLTHLRRVPEGVAALKEAAALEPDPGQAALLRGEIARLENEMRKRGMANGVR